MCDLCDGSGYVMQDVGTALIPDYIKVRCRCNPAPTDADAPDWQDVPELWAQDYPGIDYDKRIPPLRPDPSDHWLPASLLA